MVVTCRVCLPDRKESHDDVMAGGVAGACPMGPAAGWGGAGRGGRQSGPASVTPAKGRGREGRGCHVTAGQGDVDGQAWKGGSMQDQTKRGREDYEP